VFTAIAIGGIIGLLSGVVLVLLLRASSRVSHKKVSSIITIITEILGIPLFWFCGTWLTTEMLHDLPRDPYIISLAITFTGIAITPIYTLTRRVARELGEEAK
jgi:hypothetical protein